MDCLALSHALAFLTFRAPTCGNFSPPKEDLGPHLRGPAAILFMFVAIVSQNSVLVLMGYRTITARCVAKWGIAQMCLCKTKYQWGGIAPFWGSDNFP